MTSSLEIHLATPADEAAMLPLVEAFVSSFSLDTEQFAASFPQLLANESAQVLVAETDTGLVGYSLGFIHDTFYANGKVAWLEELMVAPEQRRKGIGAMLVGSFESWAKSEGAVLSALATRRAPEFYAALGYEESASYFRRIL